MERGQNEKHASNQRVKKKKKNTRSAQKKMPALQNKTSKDPWQIAPPKIKKRESHERKRNKKEKPYACRYPRLQDIAPTPPSK